MKISYCKVCHKQLTDYRSKRCKSCENKNRYKLGIMKVSGKNNPNYKDNRTNKKYYCKSCNKRISLHSAIYGNGSCRTCEMTTRPKLLKEKHPAWLGGKSFELYPAKFNFELKNKIKQRDTFKCQNCGIVEEKHLKLSKKVLPVHHIDYDKHNCKENNLITLCLICNNVANFNRDYWKDFYQNKIVEIIRRITNGN